MDPRRFDALARFFARPTSRRRLFGTALALAAGAVTSRASAQTGCPPGQTPNRKGECRCPSGTSPCLDGCFDLRWDLANCGACGVGCLGGDCVKGACRCPAGTVLCGGVCCPAGQTCSDGVCQAACVPFLGACDPASSTCCQDEVAACVQTCGPSPTCCHPPGGSCGDNCDCCGLDSCEFELGVCCRERNGSCAAGEACCGLLDCVAGLCCLPEGSGICEGDGDCCGELVCADDATCQAPFCLEAGSACEPGGDTCCGAPAGGCEVVCNGVTTCCNAPGGGCGDNCDCCGVDSCDFEVGGCCRERGGSCGAGEPCCGILECVEGVCCSGVGSGGCTTDTECCGDLVCGDEGFCEAAVCLAPREVCDPAENRCCQGAGFASCQDVPGCSFGETWCCRDLGGGCERDCDCCGVNACCGGVCTALDVQNDPLNCGGCGVRCPLNETCVAGECRCFTNPSVAPRTCCTSGSAICAFGDGPEYGLDTCDIVDACPDGFTPCEGGAGGPPRDDTCRACCPPGSTCAPEGYCLQ